MSGLKVANMAAAIWPHLAKEVNVVNRQPDRGTRPGWGKPSDGLVLAEPRQVVRDYSKVPGLVRKAKR
jgi:hypothetical protein